jgi:hypothetical protein
MFTSKKKDQEKVEGDDVGSHRQVTQAATEEENKDVQVRTVTDSHANLSGAGGNHDYGAFDDNFRGGNFHNRRGGDRGDRRGGKRRGRGG